MLKQMVRRISKRCYLGIDWQVEKLRLVLLANTPGVHKLTSLPRWTLPTPKFESMTGSIDLSTSAGWAPCLEQLQLLMRRGSLLVNVGLPPSYFTWIHCPAAQLTVGQSEHPLQCQRWAATALNLDPANLLVSHLQLAPSLDLLVVLKRHHEHLVRCLLTSLQSCVGRPVMGSLEPQVCLPTDVPGHVDEAFVGAWWLARKYRNNDA